MHAIRPQAAQTRPFPKRPFPKRFDRKLSSVAVSPRVPPQNRRRAKRCDRKLCSVASSRSGPHFLVDKAAGTSTHHHPPFLRKDRVFVPSTESVGYVCFPPAALQSSSLVLLHQLLLPPGQQVFTKGTPLDLSLQPLRVLQVVSSTQGLLTKLASGICPLLLVTQPLRVVWRIDVVVIFGQQTCNLSRRIKPIAQDCFANVYVASQGFEIGLKGAPDTMVEGPFSAVW